MPPFHLAKQTLRSGVFPENKCPIEHLIWFLDTHAELLLYRSHRGTSHSVEGQQLRKQVK